MTAPTILPQNPNPPRRISADSEPLQGWSRICYEEVGALFDAAHEGIDGFVEQELMPLKKTAQRATDCARLADDLFEIGVSLSARKHRSTLVLPSERALSHAMAQQSIGAKALDLYIRRTFGFLTTSLIARCGTTEGQALAQEALEDFSPVHHEALRRLSVGPRLLRPVLGPWRYLATPVLWWGTWQLHFKARRQKLMREAVKEALVQAELAPEAAPRIGRGLFQAATLTAACALGAGLAEAIALRALDVGEMYAGLLDEVEELLLMGSLSDAPNAERYGPGLLDIVGRLDEESSKFKARATGSE